MYHYAHTEVNNIIALIKNLDRRDGIEENEHEQILPAGTRFLHRNSYVFAYVNIDWIAHKNISFSFLTLGVADYAKYSFRNHHLIALCII